MKYQDISLHRRSFLSGAVATVVGTGVLFGESEPIRAKSNAVGGEQWTQPGGDASSSSDINGVGPTGDVSIAWEEDLPEQYTASPGAIVDGTVYTTGAAIGALDASDGTEQWMYKAEVPDKEYPEPVVADIKAPTVMGETVFAPVRVGALDSGNSFHAAIIAVDAETGTKQWRIDAPVSGQFSSVTAVDGAIFVTGPDIDGGEGRFVYALHPGDGSIRWRQPSPRQIWDDYPPIVADELVFISEQSGIKAYDATSGELVWEALSRVNDLSVALVSEGTLFVSESTEPGATVIALEAASGNERWRTAYSGDIDLEVFTSDMERLYIATSEDDGDAIALDRTDGSEIWRTTIPQPPLPPEDPPAELIPDRGMARVGELLYVGGAGLKPSDGSVVWKQGIEDPWIFGYTLYAVAGGQMYLGGDSLVVMDGTETQTGTLPTTQPDDSDQRGDQQDNTDDQTTTTHPSTPDGTADQFDGATQQTEPDRTDTYSSADTTTATDGPGFGILTTLIGGGVGAWRYLAIK